MLAADPRTDPGAAPGQTRAPESSQERSTLGIATHLWRVGRVNTIVWGSAFALVVYSSSALYRSAYPSEAQRVALAGSLSSNTGLQSLLGPARELSTVGGFAAWRSLGMLTIVGAIWGVLTGAKVLRGEEDAGRWELLLAMPVSRARATLAGIAAVGLLWLQLFTFTAIGAVLGGVQAHLPARSMLFLAVIACLPAAVFAATAVLAGQLAPTRAGAARWAAVAFAVAYGLRLTSIASGIGWLRWLSPLGWVDASRPLTGSHWWPLVGVAVLLAWLLGAALSVAARRDLGAALLSARLGTHSSRPGPSGTVRLAMREARGRWTGWYLGAVAMCFVLGLVAKSVGRQAESSRSVGTLMSRLGAHPSGTATFLGLTMSMVASVGGLAAAAAVAALCEEELSGRAGTIAAQPVSRRRWYLDRIAVDALALAVLAATIGVLFAAIGATQHLGIATGSLVAAGLNTAPLALTVLGLGLAVHSVAPRTAVGIGYALVGWSFLVEFVGAALAAPNWVLDLSLLHHLALAPAEAPRWGTNTVLLCLAVAATAVATLRFERRDLVGA